MKSAVRLGAVVLAGCLFAFLGCRKATVLTPEVVAMPSSGAPLDPSDSRWDGMPEHVAPLILQDLVDPRLMEPSTAEVRVRSITDGAEIAFRLEWLDHTKNDQPGPGRFVDACAVQLPSTIEANVPAPQMGEAGKNVEIAFWRADWQASVDGRDDSIKSLYPNATVDHYPFDAQSLEKGSEQQKEMEKRYAPAKAAGNVRAGPRETPVEDLVAQGPGTISPAPQSTSKGRGVRTETGWSVVIVRRLPEGLVPGSRSQIAFAVWEGSHNEAGARKMRTGWVPLLMKGEQ
jgi:DMSO reductase family type II enzyme heme b subunit